MCVVLTGCTVDEMLKDASLATAAGADLVEVRLDKLWTREVEMEESEEENVGESGTPLVILWAF